MTTYSRSDLATRVLRDLALVYATEVPSAADLEWAEETVSSVVAQLSVEGIRVWNGSDQSVPQEYLVPLSKRIGLDIGPSFGLFSIAEAEQAKPMANAALRRMGMVQPTGEVAQAEYF